MSDLYMIFNVTFVDLLNALSTSFPEDKNIEAAKKWATHRVTLFKTTKELFEKYSSACTSSMLTAINSRDANSLYTGNEENIFIRDIGGRKVFDDLKSNNEQSVLWNSLQNLSKHLAIMSATGNSIDIFENIARTFVSKNQGLSPSQHQTALFSQLFSDKDLSKQLLSAFENPESISKIISNLSPILSSLSPAQEDVPEDQEQEAEAEAEAEAEEEEEKDINSSDEEGKDLNQDSEDSDDAKKDNRCPSDILSKIKLKRSHRKPKGSSKNNKKKDNKNVFADLAKMMQDIDISSEELNELHAGVRATINGDSVSEIGGVLDMLKTVQNAAGQDGSNQESKELMEKMGPVLSTMSEMIAGTQSNNMGNVNQINALRDIISKTSNVTDTGPEKVDAKVKNLTEGRTEFVTEIGSYNNLEKFKTKEKCPPLELPPLPENDDF
jgi:hypothetical protein